METRRVSEGQQAIFLAYASGYQAHRLGPGGWVSRGEFKHSTIEANIY